MRRHEDERLASLPMQKYHWKDHARTRLPSPASPERRKVTAIARRILSEQVTDNDVDLTPYMDILTKELLWEISQQVRGTARHLNLSGWTSATPLELRSLSLLLGESLESINLSNTTINSDALYMVSIRFFHLRTVTVHGCPTVNDRGIEAIATGTMETLTSLDMSACGAVTEDAFGWLAGQLGSVSRPCTALTSLNASHCDRIKDRGLEYLGRGLPQLRYLDISYCPLLSDRGAVGLANGCTSLRVLSLEYDALIGDPGVLALTSNCHLLKSLNLKFLAKCTDTTCAYVAEGLPQLQSLSLAACELVTEVGLCFLGRGCRDLRVLNVSGCTEVSVRGLDNLIAGLPYVQRASSYFGFKPVEDTLAVKLRLQWEVIRDSSALVIQRNWKGFWVMLKIRRRKEADRREAAATSIQRMVRAAKGQEFFEVIKAQSRNNKRHIRMQAVARGWVCRMRLEAARLLKKAMERVEPLVTVLKAHWLAGRSRVITRDVPLALMRQRVRRRREAAVIVAHRVQCIIRAKFAKEHTNSRITEWTTRMSVLNHSALTIQRLFRGYLGRLRVAVVRAARVKGIRLRYKLCRIIQRLWRGWKGRQHAHWMRRVCRPLMALTEDRAALQIQKLLRGIAGRHAAAAARREYEQMVRTAIKLQKRWRARKIGSWKKVKLRRLVKVFAENQAKTFQAAKAATKLNYYRIRNELAVDSASDDDDENPDDWVQYYDDAEASWLWWSESRQESRADRPDDSLQEAMVGSFIQIWWPLEEKWYAGRIAAFNKKKHKFKIEYNDGDKEWLNPKEEQDRIQVLWQDDVWAYYRLILERDAKERGEKWAAEVDPTGAPFWTNRFTGEVVWEDPTRKRGPWLGFDPEDSWEDTAKWERHIDEWEGVSYRQKFTGEVVTERPDYMEQRLLREFEFRKTRDKTDLQAGRAKRQARQDKLDTEALKKLKEKERLAAEAEFRDKMKGTKRYQEIAAERASEEEQRRKEEEERQAELARLKEEEALRRRMAAQAKKEQQRREQAARRAMREEEQRCRKAWKAQAKLERAEARAKAAAAGEFVLDDEDEAGSVLGGDVVDDVPVETSVRMPKGVVLGKENRRKGKDTYRVVVTVSEGVFKLAAHNLRSDKLSVQTMSLDQMRASANPFLQEALRTYQSMPSAV